MSGIYEIKSRIEQKRKKYLVRAVKIYKDLTENMSAPWKDELTLDDVL